MAQALRELLIVEYSPVSCVIDEWVTIPRRARLAGSRPERRHGGFRQFDHPPQGEDLHARISNRPKRGRCARSARRRPSFAHGDRWRGFDGTATFSNWLHRIATNASIDLCRRRRIRPQTEIESGSMNIDPASRTTPSSREAPGTSLDRAEIKRRVEEAFSALSPEHRAVIVLKEIEDLSYEEIARHLGCSSGHGDVAALLRAQETPKPPSRSA